MNYDWWAAERVLHRSSFVGKVFGVKRTHEWLVAPSQLRRMEDALWNRCQWVVCRSVVAKLLHPYTEILHSNWILSFHCIHLRINPGKYLPICRNSEAQSCCDDGLIELNCAAIQSICKSHFHLSRSDKTASVLIQRLSIGFGLLVSHETNQREFKKKWFKKCWKWIQIDGRCKYIGFWKKLT